MEGCEIPNSGDQIVLGITAPNLGESGVGGGSEEFLIQTTEKKKERTFPGFQTTNKPKCRFWKEKKTKWTRLEKSLQRNLQTANRRNFRNQCGGLNQNQTDEGV